MLGGRPKLKPIRDDRYFLAVLRYIALNPVGVFCQRPEDYRWSSHRAVIGAAPNPPLLAREDTLGWFGPDDAVGRYARFVNGAEPVDTREVRRWAVGVPDERPPLDELVADGAAGSFLVANREWAYSIRAISRATGLNYQAVRRAIERAESSGLAT